MASLLWNVYARFFERFTLLAPYQALLDEVMQRLNIAPGMSILDAGCGPGALELRLLSACPEVSAVALDASTAMIARAKTRAVWPLKWQFLQADIDDYLGQNQTIFHRIACVNVLWALPDPGQTLVRLADHLGPEGKMVLVTPRAGFRAEVIFLQHLRSQRGWRRIRALGSLPGLILGGIVNVILVIQSLLGSRKRLDSRRFSRQGVETLCAAAQLRVEYAGRCYAGQGYLFVLSAQ